jgi:hypothetical protein
MAPMLAGSVEPVVRRPPLDYSTTRYGCLKIATFLANVPEARANLEARRLS